MDEQKQKILQTMRDHLSARGIEAGKVTMEAELANDLDLDSLDTVELTMSLEERFGIEIPDEELEGLRTVGDAVDLIDRKVAVRA